MTTFLKYIFSAIILFSGIQTFARPRFVNLDYELSYAKFVGLVAVNDFDTLGNIKFTSIEYNDTISFAYVGAEFSDRAMFSRPDLFLTASLPSIGDTVLVVIDSLGKVSLFAKQIEIYYRFWSPWITGSLALFSFSSPALPVDKKWESEPVSKRYHECWDGCFLPKEYLKSFGR